MAGDSNIIPLDRRQSGMPLRLRRKSERDLDLLERAVAKCLGDNPAPRDPRQIAREVLAAGRFARTESEFRRSLRTNEFCELWRRDQLRFAQRADRRTQPLPRLRHDQVVTRALISALEEGLARPLRFARSKTGGPDVQVLVTAWTLLNGDPDRSLPVQRPGSARWFISAIREQRGEKRPHDTKSLRLRAEES